MRTKNLTDIVRESKNLLVSYRQMQKDTAACVKTVRNNPDYSEEAKKRFSSEAQQRLADDRNRLVARLHENASEAANLIKADKNHLSYTSVPAGFFSFCQALNDPVDFEMMARKSWGNPAQIFYLQGMARKQGYKLDCGSTNTDKLRAVESIHRIIEEGFSEENSDGFLDPSIWDAVGVQEKAFASITEDRIHCTRIDDFDGQISNALKDERREAQEANRGADDQFLKGFGAEKVQTDVTGLPAFDAVRKAINDPEKEKSILSKLADVMNSKKLSGTVEADDVKLSADYYRRTGSSEVADELKAVADSMLKEGIAYVDDWGTLTQPDFNSAVKENEKTVKIIGSVVQKMAKERLSSEE